MAEDVKTGQEVQSVLDSAPDDVREAPKAVGETEGSHDGGDALLSTPIRVQEDQSVGDAGAAEAPGVSGSEKRESKIDNFDDVAELASEAGTKAVDAARNAAGQVSQTAKNAATQVSQTAKSAASQASETAKSAYSRTTEVAKRAARSAGTRAAAQAELNQERAEAEAEGRHAPESAREVVARAWIGYLASHKATVLYGIVGLVVGLCILWFGFWPVLLVVATSYAGITYGRYRDGDAKVVDFLTSHFGDED